MHTKTINYLAFVLSTFCLVSCSGFFDKDNTPSPAPLTPIRETISPRTLWVTSAGYGTREYLKEPFATDGMNIYTTSSTGTVTSVNKVNGRVNWRINTYLPITSGAGADEGIVVFGTRTGIVQALRQNDGCRIWTVDVHGEVLAQPTIDQDVVIVKTVNGNVRALSTHDGTEIWNFHQDEPNLILRASSKPLISNKYVIAGFANGSLAKLNFANGEPSWQQTITTPSGAFAIQRMIDIDADPIVFNRHIFAATYQGRIAGLNWLSGDIMWSQDISSYTGMAADEDTVYISDAKSHLWAFDAESGSIKWQQYSLESRGITGPALMCNYLIVGDSEGYLHWLDKKDGHFVARTKLKGAIYAAPVVENNVLYAMTSSGYLAAYFLG